MRPHFRGHVADAAGIAQVCERVLTGDEAAVALIDRLSEPVMRSLAKHECRPRHVGCEGPGCAVLAAAWTTWTEGRSLVDRTVSTAVTAARAETADVLMPQIPVLRNSNTLNAPVRGRVIAALLRATVDPDYADEPYQAVQALPTVERPRWWQRLHDEAQTATGPARAALCLLLVELAAPAAALADAERLRRRRFTAIGIGVVPGVLAPALVAGLIGSVVADARVAGWLFGIALTVVLAGEVLLLIAMTPARTLGLGTAFVWSAVLMGALTGAAYPEFLLGNWGWLGFCACLPVFLVPFWLASLVDDDDRRRVMAKPAGGQPPRARHGHGNATVGDRVDATRSAASATGEPG